VESANKFEKEVNRVLPRKMSDIFVAALQGNLLTPKSIIMNVWGNFVNLPIRNIASTFASAGDALISYVNKTPRTTRVGFDVFRAWIQGFNGALPAAKRIITS